MQAGASPRGSSRPACDPPGSRRAGCVDVPAGDDADDLAAAAPAAERGRDRECAGALGDHADPLGQQPDAAAVSSIETTGAPSSASLRAATSASRLRRPLRRRTRVVRRRRRLAAASAARAERRSPARRRRPACRGCTALGARDPGEEPAAAEGHEHGVDVGEVLDELEPDRAVPRHHPLVLDRVDEEPVDALEAGLDDRLPPALERHLDHACRRAARSPSSFVCGAWSGTTIVAGTPGSRAAHATPWAMFPALAVTTPRGVSSVDACRIAFAAPRILNEPTGCRFSSFSQMSVSGGAGRAASGPPRPRSARARRSISASGSELDLVPTPSLAGAATTSSAAARSSTARPSDLKTVISSSRRAARDARRPAPRRAPP